MLAHLFDHDNIYINKLEAIIDRFSELIGIDQNQFQIVRDRLINFVSLDMLAKLTLQLPSQQQEILKRIKDNPSVEEIENLKKNFKPEDIVTEFHNSAKAILNEKYVLIKSKIPLEKHQQIEDLFTMIGKY